MWYFIFGLFPLPLTLISSVAAAILMALSLTNLRATDVRKSMAERDYTYRGKAWHLVRLRTKDCR